MRKIAHPVAAFIAVVCCAIGLGVGVLAATGRGSLPTEALQTMNERLGIFYRSLTP
jgi:hypothetical protein